MRARANSSRRCSDTSRPPRGRHEDHRSPLGDVRPAPGRMAYSDPGTASAIHITQGDPNGFRTLAARGARWFVAALVACALELSAGLGQGLSEATWFGVGGARRPCCPGAACARAIANPRNATTRYVRATGERRDAALDEFAAIRAAWQESPHVVSASVCAMGDNPGPCLLWLRSLMVRDWHLRSPAP